LSRFIIIRLLIDLANTNFAESKFTIPQQKIKALIVVTKGKNFPVNFQ